MSLQAFELLEAIALPITQANVDTDQILPARYLQKPRANDFGAYLFRDLRDRAGGIDNTTFVLNQPAFKSSRIVVAERNFGCGSSREHAVWALYDYGVRAVIAPSFGDIFYSNALKNGLLPIVQPAAVVASLLACLQENPGAMISVDLATQTIKSPEDFLYDFDINPFAKHCLLKGLDELDFTLEQIDRIEDFERRYEGTYR
jgi:3-isopropylmalate/(R)-2-methylmalate dehydratase small subunit